MRESVFLALALAAGMFQSTLLELVSLWNVKPDLLLVMAVAAGLMFEPRYAAGAGAVCGLIKDAFGAGIAGGQVLVFAAAAAGIALLSRKISIDMIPLQACAVLVASAAVNIISGAALAARGDAVPAGIFMRILIISPLYTALVSVAGIPMVMALCPRRRRGRPGMMREPW